MNQTIHFTSTMFDPSSEPDNPINSIAGASVLAWLSRTPFFAGLSEADAEDWGWYSMFEHDGRSYLVGASIEPAADGNHDCFLQLEKRRGFRERLLGRAKLTSEDPVWKHSLRLLCKILPAQTCS